MNNTTVFLLDLLSVSTGHANVIVELCYVCAMHDLMITRGLFLSGMLDTYVALYRVPMCCYAADVCEGWRKTVLLSNGVYGSATVG